MTKKTSKTGPPLYFGMAIVALLLAFSGYSDVSESSDPDTILYLVEVALPLLLGVGLFWVGLKQRRGG